MPRDKNVKRWPINSWEHGPGRFLCPIMLMWCNDEASPYVASPSVSSGTYCSFDYMSLGRCFPERCVPTKTIDSATAAPVDSVLMNLVWSLVILLHVHSVPATPCRALPYCAHFLQSRGVIQYCAADFSLLNLPKGKSLGRSKPATNS